jgi:phosphoglycerate dehydrogenase-like enzyme
MASLRVLEYVRDKLAVWNLPAERLADLQRGFPGVEFVSPRDQAAADQELPSVDVVYGWAVRPHNFGSAKRLRWIHLSAAGVGPQLFPEMVESQVLLTNGRGLHAVSMAEHTLAVLFALARKLNLARDAQIERRWTQNELWGGTPAFLEITGSSLGLIGLGAVGGAIATRARALGMTVRAAVRKPREDPAPAHEVWPISRLPELAAISDWLVLAAPHTRATTGILSREVIARLRPQALVVNVGRGALVDEPALIEALEQGRIGGAALDVFAEEPLPSQNPLWRFPNVIVTPHVSGLGPRYWERATGMFADNLRAFLEGRPLANVVDKREGY